MSDEHEAGTHDTQPPPSMEDVVRLDAYLNTLLDDRRPAGGSLDEEELRRRLAAARLKMAAEDVEMPRPAFLASLQYTINRETAKQRPVKQRPLSRLGFLRAAATLAGGAGIGVAGVEGLAALREESRPHELVVAGNEHWYAVARDGEVANGDAKPFTAGGVMGFLMNDDGNLRAVSAICTHMGCRLKAEPATAELRCLCHGSRFSRRGDVVSGLAPSPLPEIAVRVQDGVVYALGTRETV
jgi:cytochrome b6-f complex iron-sulfur subunit